MPKHPQQHGLVVGIIDPKCAHRMALKAQRGARLQEQMHGYIWLRDGDRRRLTKERRHDRLRRRRNPHRAAREPELALADTDNAGVRWAARAAVKPRAGEAVSR